MATHEGVTQVNIRIPRQLARELEALAEAEHLEKIDVARQLLWEGVIRRKQELAVRLYCEGKVSKAKAAEIAGVSLWEMVDLISHRGTRWEYSLEEAKEEIMAAIIEAQQTEK
jgi:predicted HTH domain antitoxin